MKRGVVLHHHRYTILQSTRSGYSRAMQRVRSLLLLLIPLLLVPFAAVEAAVPARVTPELLVRAEQHPAEPIEIILQHSLPTPIIAKYITAHGGQILRRLPIIGGTLARVPAGELPKLGRISGVMWISPNATMEQQQCTNCADTTRATAAYLDATMTRQFWAANPGAQGQGITVAVVDSGIAPHADLRTPHGQLRIIADVPLQRNLIFNAGFEAATQSWTDWPPEIVLGRVDTSARSGSSAMLLPRNNGSGQKYGFRQPVVTFVPGQTYRFGGWGRTNGPCGSTWLGIIGGPTGSTNWQYGHWFCNEQYQFKDFQFTIPQDTTWVQVFALNQSAQSELWLDDVSLLPIELAGNAPTLFPSLGTPATMVNLSTEGTIDWVHWGLFSRNDINRKQGGNALALRALGSSSEQVTNTPTFVHWQDGAPQLAFGTSAGLISHGGGQGFELTAPADETLRTLRLYGGIAGNGTWLEGRIEAFLSDNSVLPYVSTAFTTNVNRSVVHTLSYRASRPGQTLTVRWTPSGNNSGNVIVQAATLSASTPFALSDVATSGDAIDQYGHGTHVAGIIAGNGAAANGAIVGIAPGVNLVNVRVNDGNGRATAADVIDGLQWVLENKEKHNIRVVNLSLNSSVPESYHTSALNAAVEVLWFNGIVVVVSAGNNGSNGVLYPPANDPFVITVGATDDRGTPSRNDDTLATFSARGMTEMGTRKPEIVAPGVNIVSLNCQGCVLSSVFTQNAVAPNGVAGAYFRASGTSMATPMVAAAAALILQRNPSLNPDQVKQRLISTGATNLFGGQSPAYLNVQAAVQGTSTDMANTGLMASNALTTGTEPVTDSARWGSARWGSARWGSARWGSINWSTTQIGTSMRSSMAR